MGDHEYPRVMTGELHLDPAPVLPSVLDEPAPSRIDMGISSGARPVTGKPSWLDPGLMQPVFGHYGHEDNAASRIDDALRLPAHFPGPDAGSPAPRGWGKNDAGLGVTRGDWQLGGMPVTSTSDRFDDPGTRSRAERTEWDAREAQRRGESAPDPAGDLLRGRR